MPNDPDHPHGLSDAEAAARLRRDGPNRLARSGRRGVAAIVIGVATQPMFLLLLATAAVYALVGSAGDALVLLVSVVAVGAISLVQEYRTERVLASLKDLSSPRARVVRSGRVLRIASQDLVVGDRLLVAEGDRLACDAELVQSHGLLRRRIAADRRIGAGGEVARGEAVERAGHRVQAGTLVVQGDGVGIVCATGVRTALGQIGGSLAALEPRPSRLQEELKRLVRAVAVVALLTCLRRRAALRGAPGFVDRRACSSA